MEGPEKIAAIVRRAAVRGARSVTRQLQVIEDAADSAMERWEDAIMRAESIADPLAWAFHVGMNTARKFARQGKRTTAVRVDALRDAAQLLEGDEPENRTARENASIGAGVRYWADSPDGGPDEGGLGFRLTFTLLFPK